MAKLTKAARETANELLRWDVDRVELIRRGSSLDVSAYRARQAKVQSALDAGLPAERWPPVLRDVLMALLETHMSLELVQQHQAGPVEHAIPRRTPEQLEELRRLARELGVLEQLREVAPEQWAAPAAEEKA